MDPLGAKSSHSRHARFIIVRTLEKRVTTLRLVATSYILVFDEIVVTM